MFVAPEYDVYIIKPQQILKELYDSHQLSPQFLKHRSQKKSNKRNEAKIPTENALELKMDVSQFKPEEITVKLEQNKLVIVAKHEEQHGDVDSFANYMVRKTQIPEDADLDGIVSKFSKDGILTVTAPKKVVTVEVERIIPIIRTNEVLRVEKTEKSVENEKDEAKKTGDEGNEEVKDCVEDKISDEDSRT